MSQVPPDWDPIKPNQPEPQKPAEHWDPIKPNQPQPQGPSALAPPGGSLEGYYPRGAPGGGYGSADRLQALADGYFGLNKMFLIYLLLYLAWNGLYVASGMQSQEAEPNPTIALLALSGLVILPVAAFFLSFGPNKKIAIGKGLPESQGVLYSVFVALLFWLCCGAIGFLIPQTIATSELKKYGLKVGSFSGLKKRDVLRRVAELRQSGSMGWR